MSVFVLKSKLYAQSQQEESHTGRNIALGALGTAAAIGGGFLAAKKGMLGGAAQKLAGKSQARFGKMIGSQKIVNGGVNTIGQGHEKVALQKMANNPGNRLIDAQRQNVASKARANVERMAHNKYDIPVKAAE